MAEANPETPVQQPSRIRYSLRELLYLQETEGDKKLEKFIRALRKIQDIDPEDANSFWSVASLHGEPFRGPGAKDASWWGGYCNHGNILFPTWHRAYLMRFENALRSVEGCEDVTVPFWDECIYLMDPDSKENLQPLPSILTDRFVTLDGNTVPNPLFSYKLQKDLEEHVEGAERRYSKPVHYETVRFPQSGLVGNERDRMFTELHNGVHANAEKNSKLLNQNVANWLNCKVNLGEEEKDEQGRPTRRPDTYSVYKRYLTCLKAPNYTVFSNTSSQNQWINDYAPKQPIEDIDGYSIEKKPETKKDPHYVVSLESPHNAMHLAIGGFYQWQKYDADPDQIKGANGDMGDNETASFDPIFFLHHAFVDYVFWTWQKMHNSTKSGSLKVKEGYPGTIVTEGSPGLPMGAILDMQTPLYPFRDSDGHYYTSESVTDITELGYAYSKGSLDQFAEHGAYDNLEVDVVGTTATSEIQRTLRVHNINRAEYSGSFVIRTYATTRSGMVYEIGREAVLSRWNIGACANCQNKLKVEAITPLDKMTLNFLSGEGSEAEIKYHVEVQTHDSDQPFHPVRKPEMVNATGLGPIGSMASHVHAGGHGPQIQML